MEQASSSSLTPAERTFLFDVLEEIAPGISDTEVNDPFGDPGVYSVVVGGVKMAAMFIANNPDHELATEFRLEGDGWSLFYRINLEDSEDTTIISSGRQISNRDHYVRQLAILRLAGIELWPTP